ncbi:hypothetical protein PHLGIDRAFT_108939 [Phlebiopsis gigantea 11061_1 CR5-6]|uniref:WD40 repeat-like protein n=1 Tax=Phlebiopsis gigantea (strain 11061_1 CR5-6) TaxID=745531 RepID=A0A0C3S495_PHLG1|nr:hypothetical protein PHLGIDRAFT_108939 [Phlebiopsis gigantea 11061_1 CR5-6]
MGRATRRKKQLLSASLEQPLDRVNVLGDGHSGHTGCVNALSWARDGEVLLSAGDDTTVHVWKIDSAITTTDYPFVCDAVIRTGHHGNIFNAQLLPHSSRIATVARDGQVRIADVGDLVRQAVTGRQAIYTPRQTNCRVLRCHSDSVKRIITEDSPDLFLTVSEDGAVRQHDLRTHHVCSDRQCPAPLVHMRHGLSSISLSPLTPYQFVIGGESPYGYLFDRRQTGRHLSYEWGLSPEVDSLTTCVRRFGRASSAPGENKGFEHITGVRMAKHNGHEVSYSSDASYLYSTQDHAQPTTPKQSAVLPSNKRQKTQSPPSSPIMGSSGTIGSSISDSVMEDDIERYKDVNDDEGASDSSEDEDLNNDVTENDEDRDLETAQELRFYPDVPVVLPRGRFAGACNVETVKDVNFLGPNDEFVASGSDDGNLFLWKKSTGKLHDILEGDGTVVNVIEDHPSLPLLAVSGIDTTVKLFAPANGVRRFSRIHNADNIIERNTEAASSRVDLTRYIMYSEVARRMGLEGDQCVHQ